MWQDACGLHSCLSAGTKGHHEIVRRSLQEEVGRRSLLQPGKGICKPRTRSFVDKSSSATWHWQPETARTATTQANKSGLGPGSRSPCAWLASTRSCLAESTGQTCQTAHCVTEPLPVAAAPHLCFRCQPCDAQHKLSHLFPELEEIILQSRGDRPLGYTVIADIYQSLHGTKPAGKGHSSAQRHPKPQLQQEATLGLRPRTLLKSRPRGSSRTIQAQPTVREWRLRIELSGNSADSNFAMFSACAHKLVHPCSASDCRKL